MSEAMVSSTTTTGDSNNNTMTNGEVKPKSVSESTANSGETTTVKQPEENGSEEKAANNENELILIQDNAFSIKISVPGLDPFDLQVTSMELVQEINQMLMDKEETCHRTCFSLQLDGQTLDNFSELKSIEGLKDGSVVKLVEEPYTVREVRLHVRHVNDLMHSIDQIDNFNAINCNSLTYVNEITNGDMNEKRNSRSDTPANEFAPPDYILPNAKDIPIVPLHLNAASKQQQQQQQQQAAAQQPANKTSTCLKQITFSGWNPPQGKRKLRGDLMYLHVITNEDKRYHLTASVKGFFVNQSTDDVFNPKQDNSHKLYHSLVDLLNTLSPSFKKNFSAIQKKRTSKHPFERIGTPFQVFSWLAPDFEHTVDWFRAEDANASKLGHEDHIPGHSRDWNEEIQATKELPKKTLPERLIRERAMFKVHSDFVNAATRGAIAVVESNIMAINPGEDSKIQMFIWNNMFFSLGFDVKDHYKEFGGDYAAYVAPINDLQGVKALNALDIDGLYTLGTVVVDYRGYRVTVQSIIPGILDKDQEQSVVHGSTDFGKTCATNPKYNELLEKMCAHLRMRPHKIKIENKEEIVLYSSVECKGIVGNDSRHYILDLLRMFPPDLNYLPIDENKLDAELRSLSFPRRFRHKLCCLRPELIESFVDFKYIQFIKFAALQAQQLNKKTTDEKQTKEESGESNNELEEAKKLVKELQIDPASDQSKSSQQTAAAAAAAAATASTNSSQIIADACAHVQSWKPNEFDIRFHPNLFQPVCQLADDAETLDKDAALLADACKYLVSTQIPGLVRDLAEHSIYLVDGAGLVETMHARGINVRYLGYLTQLLEKQDARLSYVHSIAVNELITRCAKRVFRTYIQSVSSLNMAQAVAHFLNCYLSNFVKQIAPAAAATATNSSNMNGSAKTADDNESKAVVSASAAAKKKKKNQKKNNRNILNDQFSSDWMSLTFKSLWNQIAEEAQSQYHFEIKLDSCEESSFSKIKARKLTLLHTFCAKNGVQLLLREFNFESKHKEAFGEDDILSMYPVVKHVPSKASDAYNFFTNGQAKIQQGFLKEGFELISESYNLLTNVYGALHPEICMCLRLLARLNYILGDYAEAMSTQHKAVMMCERLMGVDSPQTITEYSHLSLYCFANGQIANSLKLLYRARYLLLLNFGEDHPEMSLIDSNLGLILQAAGDYDNALKFLEKSLECNRKFFGPKSMKSALSYHLLARLQSCRGDFRTSLMNERETYQIYKLLLGEEDERTRESAKVLKHLTEQAVLLQKRMNEMYKGSAAGDMNGVAFPPIQIQQPSMQTVLAMLNLINGIIFIPSTHEEEYNRIRDELNRIQMQQQQQQDGQAVEEKKDGQVAAAATAQVNAQDDDLQ